MFWCYCFVLFFNGYSGITIYIAHFYSHLRVNILPLSIKKQRLMQPFRRSTRKDRNNTVDQWDLTHRNTTQQNQNTHSSQIHVEHSPRQTSCQAMKQIFSAMLYFPSILHLCTLKHSPQTILYFFYYNNEIYVRNLRRKT